MQFVTDVGGNLEGCQENRAPWSCTPIVAGELANQFVCGLAMYLGTSLHGKGALIYFYRNRYR